jgi:hypothetical protein
LIFGDYLPFCHFFLLLALNKKEWRSLAMRLFFALIEEKIDEK